MLSRWSCSALEIYPLLPVSSRQLLYALTLARGWALHTYPADHAWFFNPLAWQFLFVIGASLGYAPRTSAVHARVPTWLSAAWRSPLPPASPLISLSWTLHWLYDPFPPLLAKALLEPHSSIRPT